MKDDGTSRQLSSSYAARDERLRVRHWRIAATVSPHVSDGRAVYGVPPLADQFSKNHDEQL